MHARVRLARSLRIAGFALALLTSAAASLAQSPQPGGPRANQAVDEKTQAWRTRAQASFNISFPGGTVSEYIAALRKAAPVPVNAAMSPEVASMRLGPISMDSTTVELAMAAIRWSLDDRSRNMIMASPLGDSFDSLNFYIQGENSPPSTAFGQASNASGRVQTFALKDLITEPLNLPGAPVLTLDFITQALDAVLKVPSSASPPSIMVHRDSSIMVIEGDFVALNLATNVISSLRTDLSRSRRELAEKLASEQARVQRARTRADRKASLAERIATAAKREDALLRDYAELLGKKDRNPQQQMDASRVTTELDRVRVDRTWHEQKLRELDQQELSADEFALLWAEIEKLRAEIGARSKPAPAKNDQ